MEPQQPDLSVVCKHCGAEVSPYVTECPYCGNRLRKRAPKIERLGEEKRFEEAVAGLESELRGPSRAERLKARRRRRRQERKERSRSVRSRVPSVGLDTSRPWLLIAAFVGPVVLFLVQRAAGLSLVDVGALVTGSSGEGLGAGGEPWRYAAAPWVYDNIGYLVVMCGAVLGIGLAVQQRLGWPVLALLLVGLGPVGMVAADAVESSTIVAGGNSIALGLLAVWWLLASSEEHEYAEDEPDRILAAVAAVVLLAVPLVEGSASLVAGAAGGVAGLIVGALLTGLPGRRASG